MSDGTPAGYLPGDPRYGLTGESLKQYYRSKAAQWAIYCWDIGERSDAVLRTAIGERSDAVLRAAVPGMQDTRRALLQDQKNYVKHFGERVIGYGHFVSDDGRDTLGTSFFTQLDDRAAAAAFVAGEPMSEAGVYQRVEIHRWSNSFRKRAAD